MVFIQQGNLLPWKRVFYMTFFTATSTMFLIQQEIYYYGNILISHEKKKLKPSHQSFFSARNLVTDVHFFFT